MQKVDLVPDVEPDVPVWLRERKKRARREALIDSTHRLVAQHWLDAVTVDHAASGPFVVRATDLGREWTVGEGAGVTVMGQGADLGWWLTGRGRGEGLSSDAESLPQLGPWRRASSRAVS